MFLQYLSLSKEYHMSRDDFDRLTSSQIVLAEYIKNFNEIIKSKDDQLRV